MGMRAAAPTRSAAQMNLAEGTLNIGVIGAGRIGLVHLEAIASIPEAKPVIISNPTVSKAEAAAANYPGMEFSNSDMDVINHPDVEAVWICSPSQFHADQIRACADAGKHIFCEKPIATDLLETIEAVNYARRKGVKLMTALQRRFDPNFSRIKQAIATAEIGEPIVVKLCSRDPAPPPPEYVKGGGGIFKDMAVHDLDMARFLMGCEPVRILATGACNIDQAIADFEGPEAFDTASVIVQFENGKDAIIDVCRQAPYGYDQRAEVLGTKGMVMSENMNPSTVRKFTAEFVGQADMPFDFFMSRYKEAYVAETNAFIVALLEGKPAPCSGRDGLIALVMAMAAGKSAMEGRWVDFGEIIRQECKVDFGTLLNEEGKLGKNWVRGALLSIERDATDPSDISECFALFDVDGDGKLNDVEIAELMDKLGPELDAAQRTKVFSDADKDGDKLITLDEFMEAYKASGQTLIESVSFKGTFEFQNLMD
jgi:myo-inositol 2-dehydrogenase/D-chiro-inositol 1-dehydrogenase